MITLAIIVKGYPRLSETFIAQEIYGLQQRGFRFVIVSLRRPTDGKTHPINDQIDAPVIYLPEYLHEAPLQVLQSILKCAIRPGFYKAVLMFLAAFIREPSRNSIRRFGQACVMHEILPKSVRHLYAHFIHTPASTTQYCAAISNLSWSCSAHAKDIWLSNAADLRQKMRDCLWVATCTRYGLNQLAHIAGSHDNLHLIYHGIDWDTHPSAPNVRPLGKQDPIQFISVGRIVAKKGYDDNLAALAMLPDHINWQYHIIGGGDDAHLQQQAADAGIADRVTWWGPMVQGEVFAKLQAAQIFVMGSKIARDGDRDGMPNVLMEAMGQRLAVIATDTAAICELLDDGKTGLVVAAGDRKGLADACVALVGDADMYQRIANAGYDHVRANFSCEAGIDSLADHLRVACAR